MGRDAGLAGLDERRRSSSIDEHTAEREAIQGPRCGNLLVHISLYTVGAFGHQVEYIVLKEICACIDKIRECILDRRLLLESHDLASLIDIIGNPEPRRVLDLPK